MLKKMMCAMLVLAMAGCAKKPIDEIVGVRPTAEAENTPGESVDVEPFGDETEDDEYQIVEGEVGETLATYFFDWTVNSVEQVSEYGSIKAAEDTSLLVVNVTVKNTFKSDFEMYDADFEVIWTFDDDSFAMPITVDDEELHIDGMLDSVYSLQSREEVTGDLVFEVPYGYKQFYIGYVDMFDDGSEGDMYIVYLEAK